MLNSIASLHKVSGIGLESRCINRSERGEIVSAKAPLLA